MGELLSALLSAEKLRNNYIWMETLFPFESSVENCLRPQRRSPSKNFTPPQGHQGQVQEAEGGQGVNT